MIVDIFAHCPQPEGLRPSASCAWSIQPQCCRVFTEAEALNRCTCSSFGVTSLTPAAFRQLLATNYVLTTLCTVRSRMIVAAYTCSSNSYFVWAAVTRHRGYRWGFLGLEHKKASTFPCSVFSGGKQPKREEFPVVFFRPENEMTRVVQFGTSQALTKCTWTPLWTDKWAIDKRNNKKQSNVN